MSNSLNFYKNIAQCPHFFDINKTKYYLQVPEDWVVVMTDVVESTKAIEEGRHKDVNIAGTLAIIALANVYQNFEFPFIFGGDGATFLFHESEVSTITDVLAEMRQNCRTNLDLGMRVGIVPVKHILDKGHDLYLAKVSVSKGYDQAMISGSGIDYAEQLIKGNVLDNPFLLPTDYQSKSPANYIGLFCPFQNIKSTKEETISLIIKVQPGNVAHEQAILGDISKEIQSTMGHDFDYHPLAGNYDMSFVNSQEANRIVRVSAVNQPKRAAFFQRWMYRLSLIMGRLMFHREQFWHHADVRKFDGSLKMIISCSSEQRERLESYLVEQLEKRKVYFGLHVSDQALVTCLLHFKSGNSVHLVDGADGGYAFAARQLKDQIMAG